MVTATPSSKVPLSIPRVGLRFGTRFDDAYFFSSGRQALRSILVSLRKSSSRVNVLVPAYVCRVVHDACRAAGLNVVEYRVMPDLSVDFKDLATKLDDRSLAVLGVHFFGIPMDYAQLREACDTAGARFIEDAAHVHWDAIDDDTLIGEYGDWLFASLRKFTGDYDGALAVHKNSSSVPRMVEHPKRSLSKELRGVKFALQPKVPAALDFARLNGQHESASTLHTSDSQQPVNAAENIDYIDQRFSLESHGAMTLASRIALGIRVRGREAPRRRKHYIEICKRLASTPGVTPLYREVEEKTIPYVVPMIFESGDQAYYSVRASGVEALRWEGLSNSDCDVTRRYEKTLVQLPCHEQLSEEQLAYMIQAVEQAARAH